MIDTENLEEARKEIEKTSKEGKPVIIQGKSIDFNRIIIENRKVNMLILSHTNKKDKLKQRDSGLNHVLCNLAAKNSITLAIDMNELENKDTEDLRISVPSKIRSIFEARKEKALILSRIMQNIKLMKKAKNKFRLLNYKNKQQALSFLLTLGASTQQAKQAVS